MLVMQRSCKQAAVLQASGGLASTRRSRKFEGRTLTPCIPVLVPPTAHVLSVHLELDLDHARKRAHGADDLAKAARVGVDLLAELCWQTRHG